MADIVVESNFHIILPEEMRRRISIGQRYMVTMSAEGELILTPVDRHPTADEINEILNRTAGLWRNRRDVPADGVDYVNQLQQGRRLDNVADSWNDR